jgi:hypothetical protein
LASAHAVENSYRDVPPGTYFLLGEKIIDQSEERPDVFSSVFYPNGDDDSQAVPLRVNAGSELRGIDFSLMRTKAVRVRGRVVAAGTDRPIGDATLVMLQTRSLHLQNSMRTAN